MASGLLISQFNRKAGAKSYQWKPQTKGFIPKGVSEGYFDDDGQAEQATIALARAKLSDPDVPDVEKIGYSSIVANHTLKEQIQEKNQSYSKDFQKWLLGSSKLNKITPWRHQSLQPVLPNIGKCIDAEIHDAFMVQHYLCKLYVNGPRNDIEAEHYHRYLVYPVQKCLDNLVAAGIAEFWKPGGPWEVTDIVTMCRHWRDQARRGLHGVPPFPTEHMFANRIPGGFPVQQEKEGVYSFMSVDYQETKPLELFFDKAINPFMRDRLEYDWSRLIKGQSLTASHWQRILEYSRGKNYYLMNTDIESQRKENSQQMLEAGQQEAGFDLRQVNEVTNTGPIVKAKKEKVGKPEIKMEVNDADNSGISEAQQLQNAQLRQAENDRRLAEAQAKADLAEKEAAQKENERLKQAAEAKKKEQAERKAAQTIRETEAMLKKMDDDLKKKQEKEAKRIEKERKAAEKAKKKEQAEKDAAFLKQMDEVNEASKKELDRAKIKAQEKHAIEEAERNLQLTLKKGEENMEVTTSKILDVAASIKPQDPIEEAERNLQMTLRKGEENTSTTLAKIAEAAASIAAVPRLLKPSKAKPKSERQSPYKQPTTRNKMKTLLSSIAQQETPPVPPRKEKVTGKKQRTEEETGKNKKLKPTDDKREKDLRKALKQATIKSKEESEKIRKVKYIDAPVKPASKVLAIEGPKQEEKRSTIPSDVNVSDAERKRREIEKEVIEKGPIVIKGLKQKKQLAIEGPKVAGKKQTKESTENSDKKSKPDLEPKRQENLRKALQIVNKKKPKRVNPPNEASKPAEAPKEIPKKEAPKPAEAPKEVPRMGKEKPKRKTEERQQPYGEPPKQNKPDFTSEIQARLERAEKDQRNLKAQLSRLNRTDLTDEQKKKQADLTAQLMDLRGKITNMRTQSNAGKSHAVRSKK